MSIAAGYGNSAELQEQIRALTVELEHYKETDSVARLYWQQRALKAEAALAQQAGAVEPFGWWVECNGTDQDFGQFVTDRAFPELLQAHGVVKRATALHQIASSAPGGGGEVQPLSCNCGNDFVECFGSGKQWFVGCKPCSKRDGGRKHEKGRTRDEAVRKWNDSLSPKEQV